MRVTIYLPDVAGVWRRGSVISSWLPDLGAAALGKNPQPTMFSGFVRNSGEGRWTFEAAIEERNPGGHLGVVDRCRKNNPVKMPIRRHYWVYQGVGENLPLKWLIHTAAI